MSNRWILISRVGGPCRICAAEGKKRPERFPSRKALRRLGAGILSGLTLRHQFLAQLHNLKGQLGALMLCHRGVEGKGSAGGSQPCGADYDTGDKIRRPHCGAAHSRAQQQGAGQTDGQGGDPAGTCGAFVQPAQLLQLVLLRRKIFLTDPFYFLLLLSGVGIGEALFFVIRK